MSLKIRASHILVEKQSLALRAIERVKAGEKFEDVAREMSTCPSKKKGGDLGFFGPGMMVKPFDEAARKLLAGQMTEEPVKTGFGYHVIKRTA